MRITLVGHSCLYVESESGNLIVDPWLIGSVGWRSWWHYPPIGELDPAWFSPDFVYLTHHHPDHFHYPSLRKLDKDADVYVARFGVDVMRGELGKLGFRHVTELPHGHRVRLGPDLEIASYQYGFDDTAFVVKVGDVVAVDVNDCKLRGRALDQLIHDFGHPTFMLKTFSWAQGYPYCYTADDPADLELVTRETPMRDFVEVARHLRPRYAIPFASLVAFLHPETLDLNQYCVSPHELEQFVAASGGLGTTELVTLTPGDSWDPDGGFRRTTEDWWTDRDRRLAEQVARIQPTIDKQNTLEAGRRIEFRQFADYFEEFARSIPAPLRKRVLNRPIVFEVPSSPRPYWSIDVARARVLARKELPADTASIIRVPEAVLADAIENRITHFVQGSMRIRTHLKPGGASQDLAFWGLIMVWEIGYLPVWRVATPRFAAALVRRWREAADALSALVGRGTFLERMATNFAPPGSEDEQPGQAA
jgi:Beta-lactamase superfamily domain